MIYYTNVIKDKGGQLNCSYNSIFVEQDIVKCVVNF